MLTYLDPLDAKALRRILVEPRNSIIRQYQKMFDLEGKELSFDDEVLDMIVHRADELKLGARGLRSIIEAIMLDIMYEMPDSDLENYHITMDVASKKLTDSDLLNFKAAG